MSDGAELVLEAFAAYAAWCEKHDPEGNMTALERVDAYMKWLDEHVPIPTLPPNG